MFADYNWNTAVDNLGKSLQLMWQGMLGIFVVLGVLAIVVLILSKIPEKPEKE